MAPSFPAGIVENDGLMLHVVMQTSSPSCNTPPGWTAHPDNPKTVGGFSAYAFTRAADGTETGTLTVDGLPAGTGKAALIRSTSEIAGIEGQSSGTGSSASVADADVTTADVDRLACQLVAVNNTDALVAFTGESGGDWTEATSEYAASFGFGMQLQTAGMASSGTVGGGTFATTSAGWIVFGFAFQPGDVVPERSRQGLGVGSRGRWHNPVPGAC